MLTFRCVCGQITFFENTQCVACGRAQGFLPSSLSLAALEPAQPPTSRKDPAGPPAVWKQAGDAPSGEAWRMCGHYEAEQVCNWMVPAASEARFCPACSLNDTIPDLTVPANRERWALLEVAKRRLLYTLMRLRLPVASRSEEPETGLAFAFLADPAGHQPAPQILTGHAAGLITINIAEADPVHREQTRQSLQEPYRTLLGHFRHESGHYYWERLIAYSSHLEAFHQIFGDETQDYAAALQRHYAQGPPPDWSARFVSAYAASHPWEDWAETWAHFLHIFDTTEIALDFGWTGKPALLRSGDKTDSLRPPLSAATSFDTLIENWGRLTVAFNSINRAMGHQDLYPFVLAAPAIEKLRFVHRVIAASAQKARPS